MERLARASISRWELDALDYLPAERTLYFRVLGPESVIKELSAEICATWNGQAEVLHPDDEARFWQDIRELEWADDDSIVAKLPISPKRYLALQKRLDEIDGVAVHLSAGGACAWLAFDEASLPKLQSLLGEQELTAMVIRGKTAPLWLGKRTARKMDSAIKRVFDPDGKFPSF